MDRYTFVFVHGLSGWGSYDDKYAKTPYWGMRGGDLMAYLRDQGFDCYAASVAPMGSAWDRACEFYAQISGSRVDYGEAHSRRYGHARFGWDFSTCPLLPNWSPDTRLVLIGHSFGGTTACLFSQLMAYGDPEEQRATPESLFPLFAGGMAERIHGIVTIASPLNGTTAYELVEDPTFDHQKVKVPWWSKGFARLLTKSTTTQRDGRDSADYAAADMHVDNAKKLNARIQTLPDTIYISIPCSCSDRQPDGTYRPRRQMEPFLVMRSYQIGAYTGKTQEGIVFDETWRENDGLVNTISAKAPLDAPTVPIRWRHLQKGVWNVTPTLHVDHMAIQGGMMRHHDVRRLYLRLLTAIASQ